MKINFSNRLALVSFILAVLLSVNLSIPQLLQNSEAIPSTYVSEIATKNNPFSSSSGADQILYDYFPSTETRESNSNTNDLINELINSLIQERVAKPEICGDGQDNDGNGQIDEYCTVSDPPEGDDQSPGQEICGDGQDNDGNGQIDENCDVGNPPEGDDSPSGDPELEICGDGQDNDGNGQIDENCDVGNPPEGDDSPSGDPELEIC
ncbi:MAG TPA: MopE-related protein, partial [Nitrososphaeraceae archaeon]|nr:MopE-related protein [Nitrososphaeraceae archaeon]